MKVYLLYNGRDAGGNTSRDIGDPVKLKITLPEMWRKGPCSQLLSLFTSSFNKSHADSPLSPTELCLRCGSTMLRGTDIVDVCIPEYGDVDVLHLEKVTTEIVPEGSLVCTNFGCGRHFHPDANTVSSCQFHKSGPVFHDTEKYWSCCPEKKVKDWEEFELIPACAVGLHSTSNKSISTIKPPTATPQPITASQTGVVKRPSGSTVEKPESVASHTGPREFEGARAAKDVSQNAVNGVATCRNYGCGNSFVVTDNSESACSFHREGPVFWDTYKYWKCCPGKKCYEFEDFVKIPGCCKGPHKL